MQTALHGPMAPSLLATSTHPPSPQIPLGFSKQETTLQLDPTPQAPHNNHGARHVQKSQQAE